MLRLDHYQLAVHDLDSAVENYRKRFGMEPTGERFHNSIGNFDVVPVGYGDQRVLNLIQPSSDEAPLARFMKERANPFNPHGEGIYMLALEADDVEAAAAQIEADGGRVTRVPGSANVWVHPTASNFVFMELFAHRD